MDFDSLAQAGSIMGSGGMIVMDDHDCVVDVARYFLRFLEEESCGKCLPCRLGLKGMQEFLNNFSQGKGTPADIEALESLGKALVDGSLCGLGRTAPNPVLTSIRYFRDEYLAHIVDHTARRGSAGTSSPTALTPISATAAPCAPKTVPRRASPGKTSNPIPLTRTPVSAGGLHGCLPRRCRGRGLGGESMSASENPRTT